MPSWLPHTLAQAVAFAPIRVLFLIVVAVVARGLLHRLINRAVRRSLAYRPLERLTVLSPLGSERRAQRLGALGSLARSLVTVVILFGTVVMVLAEMGFNVNTILAGTSVVGVTIAFGLQNVVKDLVAGVFMLVEDQLGVGDWVDLEKASGTVEEIGLRVTQLRDPDGVVWYVRNGEVVRVGNFSQGGPGRPEATTPARQPTPSATEGESSTGER